VVKICGLTRADDVLLACELGAWAVGFIFAPSPRRLTLAVARALVQEVRATGVARSPGISAAAPLAAAVAGPLAIGVFGDASAAEVARVVEEVGLDGVQLHSVNGPGGRAVRAALGRWSSLLVIQTLPVAPEVAGGPEQSTVGVLRESIARAREEADVVLLDTQAGGGLGGSGMTFPWALARESADGGALLIAGGIGPGNVEAALWESGAWGVDVSSGVEASPGVKDGRLLRQLLQTVHATDHTWVWPSAGGPSGTGANL